MNYEKQYISLIEKHGYITKPKNIYVERHHRKPKCLGGSDDESNLVYLEARVHYIAHLLLCASYDWKNKGLNYAFFNMSNYSKFGKRQHSKMYDKAKRLHQESIMENNGKYTKEEIFNIYKLTFENRLKPRQVCKLLDINYNTYKKIKNGTRYSFWFKEYHNTP